MENKQQLHDELCEQCVLGTLLSSRNALDTVREYLTPDCFYGPKNQILYNAICTMADRGDTADIVTVMPELQKMEADISPVELCEITGHSILAPELRDYALRLQELNKRRKIADLGLYLYANGTSENLDLSNVIVDATDKVNALQGESASHIKKANEILLELDSHIDDLRHGKEPEYTHTGFAELDKHKQFQKGYLIIGAADSSIGKTSFANCVTLSAAANGCGIAFYSLEMTAAQQLTRLASIDSHIPHYIIRDRPLDDQQLSQYTETRNKISEYPIYFDDRSSSNIDTIIASIRTMVIKYHIGGAVIDYVQILTLNTKNTKEEQQLAEVARRLKNLAKQLNIWIMLLSQLNRNIDNPEPQLERLRGSGQINEAADTTILIYRPQYYNERYGKNIHYSGSNKMVSTIGTALINVAKSRNSECYSFICGFDGECMRFYDLKEKPTLPPELCPDDDNPF